MLETQLELLREVHSYTRIEPEFERTDLPQDLYGEVHRSMEHCEPNVRCSAEDRGREVSCEYKPVDGRMIPFGTGTALGIC